MRSGSGMGPWYATTAWAAVTRVAWRVRRAALFATALAAVHAAPVAAADRLVVADPAVQELSALDGALVWVTGDLGAQRLMRAGSAGPVPVPGAPAAFRYQQIDLGRDARGALVLTYLRCIGPGRCSVLRDDLRGTRTSLRSLAPTGCRVVAVSVWGSRTAYSRSCAGSRPSGLMVVRGSQTLGRLALPRGADRDAEIRPVDLADAYVAARTAAIDEHAFSQRTSGAGLTAVPAGYQEGDTPVHASGPVQLADGSFVILTNVWEAGSYQTRIVQTRGSCSRVELLESPPGASNPRATAVAVDGTSFFLLVPGTGIAAHDFAPTQVSGC